MLNTATSELHKFMTMLKHYGIDYQVNWNPSAEYYQQHIQNAGFSLSTFSCVVVTSNDIQYVFSIDPPFIDTVEHKSYGAAGLFIFLITASGEIRPRNNLNDIKTQSYQGNQLPQGRDALGWRVRIKNPVPDREMYRHRVGRITEYISLDGRVLYFVAFLDKTALMFTYEELEPIDQLN